MNDKFFDFEDRMEYGRHELTSETRHRGARVNPNQAQLDELFMRARKARPKGNYSVYANFRRELEIMPLTSTEYQRAVIKLADILQV